MGHIKWYKSRLYNTWCNVKSRCCNENNPRYDDYGGRGVSISDEWKNDFTAFKNWSLSNGYNDSLTIDRIDVNGNYEPSNCRWITNQQQQLNRRNNRVISYNGQTQTMSEWANQLQIGYKTLQGRIDYSGWSIAKAIETVVKDKIRDLTGKKFGRLTVTSLAYVRKHAYWNCNCRCGNKKIIAGANLTGGYTLSCGCIQRENASIMFKNRDFSKPILQYDLNGKLLAEYDSPIAASLKTGVSKANIISVANQKEYKPGKIRKQAGGYIWKYKNIE